MDHQIGCGSNSGCAPSATAAGGTAARRPVLPLTEPEIRLRRYAITGRGRAAWPPPLLSLGHLTRQAANDTAENHAVMCRSGSALCALITGRHFPCRWLK